MLAPSFYCGNSISKINICEENNCWQVHSRARVSTFTPYRSSTLRLIYFAASATIDRYRLFFLPFQSTVLHNVREKRIKASCQQFPLLGRRKGRKKRREEKIKEREERRYDQRWKHAWRSGVERASVSLKTGKESGCDKAIQIFEVPLAAGELCYEITASITLNIKTFVKGVRVRRRICLARMLAMIRRYPRQQG